MSRITVHVQVGQWPSDRDDITMCLNLDPIHREALSPLDLPNASPGFFCSPPNVVRVVMTTREGVAKELTKAIMKALGERDLIDGYPKQETLKEHQ